MQKLVGDGMTESEAIFAIENIQLSAKVERHKRISLNGIQSQLQEVLDFPPTQRQIFDRIIKNLR